MLMSVPNPHSAAVPRSDGLCPEPPSAEVIACAAAKAKRIRRVEPIKNQGRRLNVSHPKPRADPTVNSVDAGCTQPSVLCAPAEDRSPPISFSELSNRVQTDLP